MFARSRAVLLVAALMSCGGAEQRPASSASHAAGDEREADAVDLDYRIAETTFFDSIRPLERLMCRAPVPADGDACLEACAGARDVRDASARICRAQERNPAQERKCAETRSLVRRADTTCAFCSGAMTRRPCADVF